MGRGQLDRQGQAVEPDAELGHRHLVLVVQGEVELRRPRPGHKELDRGIVTQVHGRGQLFAFGQRQRRRDKLVLAVELEQCPAGDQDFQGGSRFQQLDEQRRGGYQVLEVVQHQQQLLVAEPGFEVMQLPLAAGVRQIQRPQDGRGQVPAVGDGGQRHKADAVGEVLAQGMRRCQAQPCLADARRAGDGEQAHRGLEQAGAQRGDLPFPPDQPGQGCGQVVDRLAHWRQGGQRGNKGGLAAGQVEKGVPLGQVDVQVVRQQFGHGLGWLAVVDFDLLDGGERAADLLGKLLLRQPQRLAPLPDPLAEG